MSEAPPSNPPARPRPWRRWLLKGGIIVLAFFVVCFIIVEIILLTGLPRDLVIAQVEKGFGLRMQAKTLSTGWLGNTTLDDVKLSLPLSETAFVDVPEMRVSHTNLLGVALGFPIRIKVVVLEKPVVRVSQNAAGQWNLADVAELLARTAGKKTGEETAQSSSTPTLPELHINAASILVSDNQSHSLKIDPINVSGNPESAVTYAYDVEIPSDRKDQPAHLSFRGRVAPGGTWAHDAHLWIHDIDPWIAAMVPGVKIPLAFDGSWTGQLSDKGLSGFAKISDASAYGYHVDGIVHASRSDGNISISPDNLRLRTGMAIAPEIKLPKGEIAYDGKVVRLTRMQLALLGGPMEANGWYEPDTQQGALEAFWLGLKLDTPQITQSGKLSVSFTRPPAADMSLDVLVSSSGTAPEGNFEAAAKLNVSGRTFSSLRWNVDAPQLAWYRPQSIILDGIKASGTFRKDPQHSLFTLSTVSLPRDNRLTGTGSYDFSSNSGEINLSGQDWPVHLLEGTRLAFGLEAHGHGIASKADPKKTVPVIELSQFYLRSGESGVTITGQYDGQEPKPVSATVVFENRPGSAPKTSEAILIEGQVRGEARLRGTLDPLDITMGGTLDGSDATVLNHPIGSVHSAMHGAINFQKAVVHADSIPFLDGLWSLGATYVLHEDDRPVYATTIDIAVDHLPLPKVSEFVGVPVVQGMFDGRWYVYYPRLKPEPDKVIVTGAGTVNNASYQNMVADKITFQTRVQRGVASIKPIVIQRHDGRIDALASVDLSQWRRIHTEVKFTAFPIDLGNGTDVQIAGGSQQIDLLLPDATATDPVEKQLRINAPAIDVKADVNMNKQHQGEVRLTAAMLGRVAELKELNGEVLGGKITATASTDVDHLDEANASFTWDSLQSGRIINLYPQLQGLVGTFSGNVRVQPALVSRPLQPLQIDAYIHCDKGRWREVTLGDGQVHAFGDPYSKQLIASNSQISSIQLAGGSADMWFSASRHIDTIFDGGGNEIPSGVTLSNLLNINLKDLQVDQFVKSFQPKHEPGLGKLSGKIYTLSAAKTKLIAEIANQATTLPTTAAASQSLMEHVLATTTVDGSLHIDHSDLGTFGPVAGLYGMMHLGANVRTPTGTGEISLHVEQGMFHVTRLYYFNKGVEVRAVADVDRTWELPDCSIKGSAAGSLQALKNVKIPVLAEANAVLASLQGSLTGVEFSGTVTQPTRDYLRQIGLTQFGAQLKGLFLSELGAQRLTLTCGRRSYTLARRMGLREDKLDAAVSRLDDQLSSLTQDSLGPAAPVVLRWRSDAAALLFHLRRKAGAPPLICVLGGTGTGKSTIVNRLLGATVSATSFRRTFTSGAVAATSQPSNIPSTWLGIEHEPAAADDLPARGRPGVLIIAASEAPLLGSRTVIDTPDLDGDQPAHHTEADRAFRWADAVVVLVTPEKYQMTEMLPYYRLAERYAIPGLFLMNKCEQQPVIDDYARLLKQQRPASNDLVFAVARDDAGFEPPSELNLDALRHAMTALQPVEGAARQAGLGNRAGDLVGRAEDQILSPLRRARADIDNLIATLRASETPVPGVDVNPVTLQLQRRMQQRSVLYLMGPQRILDRVRQAPGLLVRLPARGVGLYDAWRNISSGLESE